MKFAKFLCMALCLCMLVGAFVSCTPGAGSGTGTEATSEAESNSTNETGDNATTEAVSGNEETTEGAGGTSSAFEDALEAIKNSNVDFSNHNEFNILMIPRVENMYKMDEPSDEPLEQAVYERNVMFEEMFPVDLVVNIGTDAEFTSLLSTDVKTDRKYDIMFYNTDFAMTIAGSGLTRDFLAFDALNLDASWWDQGTKNFEISDRVWFMNGSFNTDDDNCTYVLMFNKDMYEDRKDNYEKSFYESATAGEWTLDYFQQITQGVSSDNGDGNWDEKDTYGFVTTWEYGTTFFYACDMHYVTTNPGSDPVIDFNADAMEKASNVLDKVLAIYYTKNATYWPAGGKEALGLSAFQENRAMFYGEVVSYIIECSKVMNNFGILPIPKYDQEQDGYRTWTHGISCSMTISKGVDDDEMEAVGTLIEAFNLASEAKVRPTYYDKVLYRKSTNDVESRPMLDIIFNGKVYDLAMYNADWGLVNAFKECVNNNKNELSSKLGGAQRSAGRKLASLIKKLNNQS